jgi:hypothetical protein
MKGGTIARQVIEMASTDIRLLFRKTEGTTPVSCLLGVLNMNDGVGNISPLRIRAASGTVVGEAQFDLYRRTFDLTIGSQPASTGIFALDIPIRVYGTFANPTVRPAQWSPANRARVATSASRLPPSLLQLVNRNPCLHAQAWAAEISGDEPCPHSKLPNYPAQPNHAARRAFRWDDCSTTVSMASATCLVAW